MTVEHLAEFIQRGGNDELLPLLWEKTKALIYMKCSQYWGFYSEKLERFGYSLDDLRQEGYNALVFAIKQYKSDREYKFATYLNYALKHIIRDLLSGSDVLNQAGTESLEKPLGESDSGEPLTIGDTVADERATAVYEDIERSDEYNVLYEAIDSLPQDYRELIVEYYFKGYTYKRIDEKHGRSNGSSRQLLHKALRALRSGERWERLRSVYGAEYSVKHKSLAAFRSSGTSEIEDYVLRVFGSHSLT